MGDHFVLLVDRLITESTLEAAIQSRNRALVGPTSLPSVDLEAGFAAETMNLNDGTSDRKLVECRICQEEDEVSSMETPCSCCGSLKYAHRKCVQRWCNEKGDTICEICLQQFKPGYTAPPQLFHYGGIPMNFRGNWEIPRRDLHNSPFIAMVATDRELMGTDRELMGSDYDDYSASSTRSLMYCRSVAVIFMVLLVLRHTLPVILSGAEQDAFAIISLLMLRTAGILLPIYVMARALITFRRWRHQQEIHELSLSTSEGDSGHSRSLQQMQPQPHLIHVH